MVRKFAALFALILTLGLAATPVAAQDIDTDDLSDIGLQSGYLRMYMADPAAENANPDLLGVMVVGLEFENDDVISDEFDNFTCGFASGFLGIEEVADCEGLVDEGFEVSDVDGIGDQAMEINGEAMVSGSATPTNMLAIQSDNYIFVVIHLGDDSPEQGDAIGKVLADAEVSDSEVVFDEDGLSTGGFYDMLPADDDEALEGLIPMIDQDLFGSVTGTPSS